MDLIDNDSQYREICVTLKYLLPLGISKLLHYYYIIRLKTVRTRDNIIYLEPKTNLCLSVKLLLDLK